MQGHTGGRVPEGESLVLRSPVVVRFLSQVMAAGFLIAAVVGVVLTLDGLNDGRGVWGFAVVLGFIAWAGLLWRLSSSSVVLTEEELIIRNFLTSHRVPLSNVKVFRVARGLVYPGAFVELISGGEIFLSAIQKSNLSWVLNRYSRADRLVDVMNDYVQRIRSSEGTG